VNENATDERSRKTHRVAGEPGAVERRCMGGGKSERSVHIVWTRLHVFVARVAAHIDSFGGPLYGNDRSLGLRARIR
jgi:hypothetical protein